MAVSASSQPTEQEPPDPGEQRQFWTDQRAKRRHIKRVGRRKMPTDADLSDAPGDPDNWVRVEDSDVDGLGVFEWVPPEPPDPETVGVIHDRVIRGRVWDEVTAGRIENSTIRPQKQDGVAPETPPETETAMAEVPVAPTAETTETTETPESAASESERDESMDTVVPAGTQAEVVSEGENSLVFQEGDFYTVQNTETGDKVTLPAGEWERHAAYLKRGSRRQ